MTNTHVETLIQVVLSENRVLRADNIDLKDQIAKIYATSLSECRSVDDLPHMKSRKGSLSSAMIQDFRTRLNHLFELYAQVPSLITPVNHNYKYFIYWATATCDTRLLELIVEIHPEMFFDRLEGNLTYTLENGYQRILQCPAMVDTIVDLFFDKKRRTSAEILRTPLMKAIKKDYDQRRSILSQWFQST